MIAGTWGAPMPQEPGPERDQWLRVRGWGSYEKWQEAMDEAQQEETEEYNIGDHDDPYVVDVPTFKEEGAFS